MPFIGCTWSRLQAFCFHPTLSPPGSRAICDGISDPNQGNVRQDIKKGTVRSIRSILVPASKCWNQNGFRSRYALCGLLDDISLSIRGTELSNRSEGSANKILTHTEDLCRCVNVCYNFPKLQACARAIVRDALRTVSGAGCSHHSYLVHSVYRCGYGFCKVETKEREHS